MRRADVRSERSDNHDNRSEQHNSRIPVVVDTVGQPARSAYPLRVQRRPIAPRGTIDK